MTVPFESIIEHTALWFNPKSTEQTLVLGYFNLGKITFFSKAYCK